MSKVAPEPKNVEDKRYQSRDVQREKEKRKKQEEVDAMVKTEMVEKEKELRVTLEKEIEGRLKNVLEKQFEEEWKAKYDVEIEKNETWMVRIKAADDRTKTAEAKLFSYEEAADALAAENRKIQQTLETEKHALQVKLDEANKSVQDLKENERDGTLRIANLENQLSIQSGRAESLEQSYAAELEKSEKQNTKHSEEIATLTSELDEKKRHAQVMEDKHATLHEESQELLTGQQRGESSKLLFTFVSARMKRAVVIAMAKWKLYNLHHENQAKHSNMINDHNDQLVSLRKDKEEELLKSNNEAAQLRLNYEATIRDLKLELEQMGAALVKVARPSATSPVFNRGLALKRCNFG